MNKRLNKKTALPRETSVQDDPPCPQPSGPAGFPESLGLAPMFSFFLGGPLSGSPFSLEPQENDSQGFAWTRSPLVTGGSPSVP